MDWRLSFFALVLLVALTSLSGCKQSDVNMMVMALPGQTSSPAHPTLTSLKDGRFYSNGFPTDLRRDENGAIDIADFPRQMHWLTRRYVNAIDQNIQGYHTSLPVYLPFYSAIDVKAMSRWDADYAATDSPVQLIDIDPASPEFGRRFPLRVSMTTYPDTYRPTHLLQVMVTPGISLRPNTTYGVLVFDHTPLKHAHSWQQHPQLQSALQPDNALALGDAVRNVYAPLRDYLQTQHIDPASVMGATLWTTGDPLSRFHRAGALIAQQAEQLSTLPVQALENYDDYPEYCVIRGVVELPGYQKGIPPYLVFGGQVEWESDGAPKQQYTRNAEFMLTIPKQGTMPASGYPWLSYVHGAGGRARQVFDRGEFDHLDLTRYPYYIGKAGEGPAQIAAERGWAATGLAGHLAYDHIPQWSLVGGTLMYNLYNPEGMAGTYMTLAWERIFFRRIVERLSVPRDLCPDADPGPNQTAFRFAPDKVVNLGQSHGNWVSTLMVSADPRPYQGVIFSGAAGTWTRLFNNNVGFELAVNTAVINRIPFLNLDDAHPFLMLMEWTLGAVETTTNVTTLMRYPAKTPPHVIGFSGYNDFLLRDPVQQPFFLALGSDLLGDDIGWARRHTLMPELTLGGARQLSYPAVNNQWIEGHGPRTNVVMRYRGDNPALLYNGHEVLFQSDPIKHQYGCFLAHLAQDVPPQVDVGLMQGDSCSPNLP